LEELFLLFLILFLRKIYNDSDSSDEEMNYDEENSYNDGYISDIETDDENYQNNNSETQNGQSVPDFISDNNSSNESLMNFDGTPYHPSEDLENFHHAMEALDAIEFHNVNETGPIEVRISAFNTQTTTITEDELDHIRTGGLIHVNVDGVDYVVGSDHKGQIRCLTDHSDIDGEQYYQNEGGFIIDLDESSGEE